MLVIVMALSVSVLNLSSHLSIEEESFAPNVKAESVPAKSVQLQGDFPPLVDEAFQIALKALRFEILRQH
jgi:hypothetical protein